MRRFLLVAVAVVFGLCSTALAQWSDNTNINAPVSTALNDQITPMSVSDGAGGMIIAWNDLRNDTLDIYAQRLNSSGVALWTTNGVPVVKGMADKTLFGIVSDGANGAIVVWVDTRNAQQDIYAQRLNGSGSPVWTAGGVSVCSATADQDYPRIISDGSGGAIITWEDPRSGSYDIYAQRLNSSGIAQWTVDGIAVNNSTNDQVLPVLTTDGANGAIVAWQDYRSGSSFDVYAQRISGAGTLQWLSTGDSISHVPGDQQNLAILSDGSGGAFLAWQDGRNDPGDIYAQRVNSAGTVQWTKDGVPVSAVGGVQDQVCLVSDGSGGFIAAWRDSRSGTQIYAQRVNNVGASLWSANGNALTTTEPDEEYPAIVQDGSGGAVISWQDHRSSTWDIYAQRINGAGVTLWNSAGSPVSQAASDQIRPNMVSNGSGGAMLTWQDIRSGAFDVYAQLIGWNGALGNGTAYIRAVRDVKADQGGVVEVLWNPSPYDVWPEQYIDEYDVWMGVKLHGSALSVVPTNGSKKVRYTVMTTPSSNRTSSVAADTIYWQYVGYQDAAYRSAYSLTVNTLSDSTAKGVPWYYFMVTTYHGDTYWDSPIDSGYSVDNLPPAIVANVVGSTSSGTETLHWSANTDKDLAGYQVYRSATPGFNPLVMAPYATTTDTTYTDANATGLLYYAVLAVDIHGNLSAKSNEVSTVVSGVDQTAPIPTVFALEQNYPNPFNPSTVITYDVPKTAVVQVTVYDLLGRAVAELVNGEKTPGQYQVVWNADRMSSGIYYVRMQTQGFVATRKVVLMK